MRVSLLVLLIMVAFSCADNAEAEGCMVKGVRLWGKVKVVNTFPDLRVQVVDSLPDLDVMRVAYHPNHCGEWQMVEGLPDFTIQFVSGLPDLKIRFVSGLPGER